MARPLTAAPTIHTAVRLHLDVYDLVQREIREGRAENQSDAVRLLIRRGAAQSPDHGREAA